MEKLEYKKELFDEHFSYSEDSPSRLVRKGAGVPVGYFDKPTKRRNGCWRVRVNKKAYQAHRVIWCLLKGDIPEDLVIDHVDGDPCNNKIGNLRLVTQKENQRNRSKNCNNRTGAHGVSTHKTATDPNKHRYNTYVRATWVNPEGKQKWKDFNVKDFPSFEHAVEFAALYREMKIEDKHTYSPLHGVRESKQKQREDNNG